MQTAATPDPDQVTLARDAILAREEFQYAPGWLERYVLPKLEALVHRLGLPWHWLSTAFHVAALVFTIALLVAITVALIHALRGGRPEKDTPSEMKKRAPRQEPRTPDALLEEARAHHGRGAWADAIRAAWLASIAALDKHLELRGRAERADDEYVREASSIGAPLDALRPVLAEFRRTRYGGHVATARDATTCIDRAARVMFWSVERA
jgi:hypothetical protein